MNKFLQKLDSGLFQVENFIILLTLGSMVILSFLQVVLRNFFDTGLLWGDILLRHLVLWVGFVGASLATREEKHINVDVLTRLVSQNYVPFIQFLVNLAALVICFILAKASYVFLSFEIEAGTTLFLDIPSWYIQIILPIGFGLIGLRFLLKIFEQISRAVSGQSVGEER
ncbi:MAG: TRAP transporter small permease [bacterium]|nr:MAG: TRAP transporter small permease [bacterium]